LNKLGNLGVVQLALPGVNRGERDAARAVFLFGVLLGEPLLRFLVGVRGVLGCRTIAELLECGPKGLEWKIAGEDEATIGKSDKSDLVVFILLGVDGWPVIVLDSA
jgi:hypothetical protein